MQRHVNPIAWRHRNSNGVLQDRHESLQSPHSSLGVQLRGGNRQTRTTPPTPRSRRDSGYRVFVRRRIKYRRATPGEVEKLVRKDR